MLYIYMHYYEEPENRFIKYTYIKHYNICIIYDHYILLYITYYL